MIFVASKEDKMNWNYKITWCVGCGIEITWGAYIKNGKYYCCEDCSEGKPCQCDVTTELDLDIRTSQFPTLVKS